uniref:Uncharacterized protein n=1 Tax=Cuerna arida TaxID=1464854 RepID=A0A1B6FQU2_9HEMI
MVYCQLNELNTTGPPEMDVVHCSPDMADGSLISSSSNDLSQFLGFSTPEMNRHNFSTRMCSSPDSDVYRDSVGLCKQVSNKESPKEIFLVKRIQIEQTG